MSKFKIGDIVIPKKFKSTAAVEYSRGMDNLLNKECRVVDIDKPGYNYYYLDLDEEPRYWWPEYALAPAPNQVNHPTHYGGEDNPYEAIKVIEFWDLDFCLGNAVKYISRAGKKDDAIQDLKKAIWYLERKIEQLKKLS